MHNIELPNWIIKALPKRDPKIVKGQKLQTLREYAPELINELEVGAEHQEWITPDTPLFISWALSWVCPKNPKHKWREIVHRRNPRGRALGCPYCAGKRVFPGDNDIASIHPELITMWSEKNEFSPQEITKFSKKKMILHCKQNHTFTITAGNYSIGKRCPYCAKKKIDEQYNVSISHPEIKKFWHHENPPIEKYASSSRTKVKFKCPHDSKHEWSVQVESQAKRNRCPYCSGHFITIGANDLKTTHPLIADEWDYENNKQKPEDYSYGSSEIVSWVCPEGHNYLMDIVHRTCYSSGCRVCNETGPELFVRNLLKTTPYAKELVIHSRKIIRPLELDFYIPSRKIAFEVNGVYWHSNKFLHKHYHADKHNKAKEAGVQLYTIWEDDIVKNPELIKKFILHKLGVAIETPIAARKTSIVEINYQEAMHFLNKNHIQGSAVGNCYLGLRDGISQELVAVSVWSKIGTELSLQRYATSRPVPGGMGKMIHHAPRFLPGESTSIVTFADKQVSNGGSYETLGFRVEKELRPDYKYLIGQKRIHKFNYRKERFKTDPDLKFESSMTESELATLNNLLRCYDAGKIKYRKDL